MNSSGLLNSSIQSHLTSPLLFFVKQQTKSGSAVSVLQTNSFTPFKRRSRKQVNNDTQTADGWASLPAPYWVCPVTDATSFNAHYFPNHHPNRKNFYINQINSFSRVSDVWRIPLTIYLLIHAVCLNPHLEH